MEKDIELTKVIGKSFIFCDSCTWFNFEEYETSKPRKCPKCKSWCWEIYEYHHYDKKGKLITTEAGITDNDENTLHGDSLKELKKIFDRGMYLLKYKKIT